MSGTKRESVGFGAACARYLTLHTKRIGRFHDVCQSRHHGASPSISEFRRRAGRIAFDGLKHFILLSLLSRPFSLRPRHRRIVMEKVLIALAAALGIALGTIPYLNSSPAQGQASIEWTDDAPDVVHGIPDDPMDFFR